MKFFYLILAGFLLLTACTPDEAPVRETADAYLTARLKGDFVAMAEYVDKESADRLEDLELLVITESSEDFTAEYTIDDIIFETGKAHVVYTLVGFGQDTLELLQREASWKIDLSSNSAVPDAGVLWQELRGLEEIDTTQRELKALDRILLEEDSLGEAFDAPVFELDSVER